MSDPGLTVLLPVFEAELYLEAALRSVLQQTYTDFEVLAVNDGSQDRSGDILDRFAATDRRIRVIHRSHGGIVAALNSGLAVARGELIARMDADDLCHPDRFDRQVAFLRRHPRVAAVGCQATEIDERGRPVGNLRYPESPEDVAAALARSTGLCHPAVMMRRDVIQSLGGYRTTYPHAEDRDLWLRVSEHHQLANLPDCLFWYRSHSRRVSARHMVEQVIAGAAASHAAARRRLPPGATDATGTFLERLLEGIHRSRPGAIDDAEKLLPGLKRSMASAPLASLVMCYMSIHWLEQRRASRALRWAWHATRIHPRAPLDAAAAGLRRLRRRATRAFGLGWLARFSRFRQPDGPSPFRPAQSPDRALTPRPR